LASQVTGASLFGCQLDSVPKVMAIYQELLKLDAFAKSAPQLQADAPAPSKN
jgi:hypothetical protein